MLYHDRRNPVSRTMEASRCADRMILASSFRSKGGWRSGAARKTSVEAHSSYCRDNDYWRCLHDMHAGSEEVYKDSRDQQRPVTPTVFEMQAPNITHHTDECHCCKYSVVELPIDQRLRQPYLVAGDGWGDPQIQGLRSAPAILEDEERVVSLLLLWVVVTRLSWECEDALSCLPQLSKLVDMSSRD